jgi:hypothetical protein
MAGPWSVGDSSAAVTMCEGRAASASTLKTYLGEVCCQKKGECHEQHSLQCGSIAEKKRLIPTYERELESNTGDKNV